MIAHPHRSTLFPYTTLFRSVQQLIASGHKSVVFSSDTRPAPLAFLLGEFERESEAENRERDALERSIPAYVIPFPHPKDRKSTRLNSSHGYISYAVFCLKKK